MNVPAPAIPIYWYRHDRNRPSGERSDDALSLARPFHRQMSRISDAIIIEIYIGAPAKQDCDNVLVFATPNIHDFSQKGADTGLPHPNLAAHFNGTRSGYSTNLGALLNQFLIAKP